MKGDLSEIQDALTKYNLLLNTHDIKHYQDSIWVAQQYFPIAEQHALIIKLLKDWESLPEQKIITVTSEACRLKGGTCVTTFGILSVDWPGLFDSCSGVIHESGWNIYFIKGISIDREKETLGIVLIGIRTEQEESYERLTNQVETIITKIHQAAVGTKAKTFLLKEEYRKLEIYSQVISHIEKTYRHKDLEAIIDLNGEAVKYFAARSRDYIENRRIEEIAKQIIRNYTFIKKGHESGKTIQLYISNFKTKKEGIFTGVTVSGRADMLHLEDCLKTIELTTSSFQLKHNREFTTEHGISLYRIEFVDSSGHPLTELDQKRLKKAFSTMVLNKRRDRAQWIESIGGFEQYARAIIPLLVREAQHTGKTQVYQSVGKATNIFIDFKIIVVVPSDHEPEKGCVTKTVNQLESVPGIHIHSVKPPKRFGNTQVFIIDLRVNTTDIVNTEKIYSTIKENIYKALGEFRDFDEGMRTIDTLKLKSVRQRLDGIDKTIIRELYYSIEDFFRVSASVEEIIVHIRLTQDMLNTMPRSKSEFIIRSQKIGVLSKTGTLLPRATLLCLSYLHRSLMLPKILEIFEPYEVTLSRLEKMGRDIITCRITKNEKALTDDDQKKLIETLEGLNIKREKIKKKGEKKH